VNVVGFGNGSALEVNYANHAYPVTACTGSPGMRELGLVYDGAYSLSSMPTLDSISGLHAIFDAQVTALSVNPDFSCPNGYEVPFDNLTQPWSYLTADLRLVYPNGRLDILSVHFWNATAFLGDQNYVYWSLYNSEAATVMLNPAGAGYVPPITVGGGWATVNLDMKGLYDAYVSPPDGYTTGEAQVVGFDVYASLRGVDLNYAFRNVRLEAN
jgi:hypothetical protein